jgi:hypothetical protein
MKKVKWIVFNSLVIFLFLPAVLNAEEIGILPFRSEGVEIEITEDFYDLLEDELDYFDHKVVSPYEIEDYVRGRVISYNKDYAADYGRSLGLEKVIFGSITNLNDEYVILVTVVESGTGEELLIDKITLESEDYLEAYVYSLAKAIEEEVYGNAVCYRPDYINNYSYVHIGTRYCPRRVIRRHRHRSSISISIPLFKIHLGRPYHRVVHGRFDNRNYVYQRPNRGRRYYGKSKKGSHHYGGSQQGGHEKKKKETHRYDDALRRARKMYQEQNAGR